MAGRKAVLDLSYLEGRIVVVRGQKVLLDHDLAELYGVETRRLNEQVRRNAERFPQDFMFSLTNQEVKDLKSQFATLGLEFYAGGPRATPKAFTEHGAIMAASVLNSPRAISASVFVVRAFVKLRGLAQANQEITKKLNELERRVGGHDSAISALLKAINQLVAPAPVKKRSIGFASWPDGS
jgi:hypothetical protein